LRVSMTFPRLGAGFLTGWFAGFFDGCFKWRPFKYGP